MFFDFTLQPEARTNRRSSETPFNIKTDKMEQFNRIEIRGLVGNIRHVSAMNKSGANFTIATNYAYKDKDGTPVIDTTWFSVVAWEGKSISGLSKIASGTPLEVTGRIRARSYVASDGEEKRINEVVANKIVILDADTQLVPSMN